MTGPWPFVAAAAILGLVGTDGAADAPDRERTWTFPGFCELTGQVYEGRPDPADTRSLAVLRGGVGVQGRVRPWLSLHGRWDFRADTHTDVDERRWFDLDQRGLRPPAGALGELYLDLQLGRVDLRAGTQEVRWGRADGFNPTDNVNPYDYTSPLSVERLAVPVVRAETSFGRAALEGVWVPFFTPTRLPLLGKRWYPRLPRSAVAPLGPAGEEIPVGVAYQEGTRAFPSRTLANGQWGLRWNQVLSRGEFSLSYFRGFDDIGFFRAATRTEVGPAGPGLLVVLNREYFRVGVVGFDFASELGPIGIRGEAALFDQTDPDDLDRLVYVVGVDRHWKDWFVIVQYTDRLGATRATATPVFPDLGFRSTLLSRIERTIGPSQSLELKAALRLRDGDFLLQPSYSAALTDRWRLEVAATLIAGARRGYLGQYRGNDGLTLRLRYAF